MPPDPLGSSSVGRRIVRGFYILLALVVPSLLVSVLYSQITLGLAAANRIQLITTAVVIIIYWGTSVLVLVRPVDQLAGRLYFLLAQVAALAYLPPLAYPLPLTMPAWLVPLNTIRFLLVAPVMLHYSVTFPVRLGSPLRRRLLLGLCYAVSAPLIVIRFLGLDPHFLVTGAYSTVVTLLAIGIPIYVYLRRADPGARRRLRLITFGMALAIIPSIFFYFIPRALHMPYQMPEWLVGLFLIVAPVCYLIAITQHHLFGIDRLLNRTLVALLLSAGILAVFLVPLVILYRALPGQASPGDWLAQAAVFAGVTLVIGWNFTGLRTQVERLVDRLFYGGWYDYPGVVDAISDALARSLSPEQVEDVLTRRVPQAMQLQDGLLRLVNQPDGGPPALPEPCLSFSFALQGGTTARWWVSGHRDGEDFSAQDRRILKTLAQQAEIALNNVVLVEALHRQIEDIRLSREILAGLQRQLLRSREDERSRLARDLHDGPIQTLVGLNLQLGMLLASPPGETGAEGTGPGDSMSPLGSSLEGMRVEVRGLLTELREFCAELRPPMLDMLGLGAAVRVLVEAWEAQHGIQAGISLPPDIDLRGLKDEVAVNLYRVVQEALANIAHHAAARTVQVSLTGNASCLDVEIRDDGRGFDVDQALSTSTQRGHFGLSGMRERIDLIGGDWRLQSAPGQGTSIHVVWPKPPS